MARPTSGHDVVVLGGTAAGVATAVRAAREGCRTALVTYHGRLGGMVSNMGTLDTRITKRRSPVFDELVDAIDEHYRSTYGPDSDQYRTWQNGYFYEPKVAESVCEDLVAAESGLERFDSYRVATVERDGSDLQAVVLTGVDSGERLRLPGGTFVDATYEGDLAGAAGVPYHIGRESRGTYDEQFAGRVFVTTPLHYASDGGIRLFNRDAVGHADVYVPPDALTGESARSASSPIPAAYRQGDLDMQPNRGGIEEILSGSTGEGDDAIQAYNYRIVVSRDPENRRRPEKPENYDREEYLDLSTAGSKVLYEDVEKVGLDAVLRPLPLPNDKADLNTGDLPGENHGYPEATWDEREQIAARHRDYLLGLLYFLQNDDAIPESIQTQAREWGLATDEFPDNDNFPWQLYVREGRRIEGRATFTENDARVAAGLERAPVTRDAVGINDFPIDSHGCRNDRQPGSQRDGHVYLTELTRPGQVSYRSLLPKGVDNLIVPVALSASHLGFSTVRFEPAWTQLGEIAGYAAALAHDTGTPAGELDPSTLQRELVEDGVMISFFNEFDVSTDEPWVPAVQFLGAKGFFESYNASPDEPLSVARARSWARTTRDLIDGDLDATERARTLPGETDSGAVTVEVFVDLFREALDCAVGETDESVVAKAVEDCGFAGQDTLSRAEGARVVYRITGDVTAGSGEH